LNGHQIDLESWPRRAQYEFFRGYDLPFFNLCAKVDVTKTRAWCKTTGASYSLATWFACQQTINTVPEFKLRLRPDGVWRYDQIQVSMTVLQDDETFRFCYLPFSTSFPEFERLARQEMANLADGMDDREDVDAVIHGTTLPWLDFTSVSHPRRFDATDSVPKITFGKRTDTQDGRSMMPVSVEVHHALMDGLHASRFFQELERLLAAPATTFA